MKYIFLFSILIVAAKGCGDKKVDGVVTAGFGEEVTLKVGEALHIEDSDKQGFLFAGVEKDSRCPKGVNCIQAGSATFLVEELESSIRQVTLPADAARSNTSFSIKGAKVVVLGLDPYPVEGERPAPEDYQLRVRLEKGAATM